MDQILIYVSLGIIAVCLLMIVGFGAKNAGARLKGESKMVLFAFALPLVLLGITFAVGGGSWTNAFVYTAVLLTLLGLLSLLVTGARNLFS